MLRNLYFVTIVMITVQFPLYRDQFMQLSVFRNDFVVKNRSRSVQISRFEIVGAPLMNSGLKRNQ